jgi:hypothetical protein
MTSTVPLLDLTVNTRKTPRRGRTKTVFSDDEAEDEDDSDVPRTPRMTGKMRRIVHSEDEGKDDAASG